ncbi:hypothetical protein [Rufibacter soli]
MLFVSANTLPAFLQRFYCGGISDEGEQLSLRIKSGIQNRKAQGLHTGRKVGWAEFREKLLGKHKEVIQYLKLGKSYQEITKLTGAAPFTISRVKKALAEG